MIAALLAGQNEDGGWGVRRGAVSWTEPTAWVLLALHGASKEAEPAGRKGVAWLQRTQLPDGGWAAAPGIGGRCWVSAVAALLPPELLGGDSHRRVLSAVAAGAEPLPTITERLRQWMLGNPAPPGPPQRGWAWMPGTAAWITPTAVSLLALKKFRAESADDKQLLAYGRNYLFARQCADGGWNHGSSRALGYEGASYPETTGLALLALRGERGAEVQRGLDAAERHSKKCQTFEGACWLRLALHAHGRSSRFEPPAGSVPDFRELALQLIVERAIAGDGLLWRN